MGFLPVGRRRHMESQVFKFAEDQIPQPDMDSVYMGTGSSAPLPGDMAADVQQVSMDSGDHGGEVEAPQSLREFVFAKLLELGVEQRHLTDPKTSKRIFSKKEGLGTNSIVGHFMIPSATASGLISESDAKKIASDILGHFRLDGEMGHEGRNYMVSFRSRKEEAPAPSGDNDSFADLKGDTSSSKTASSVMGDLYMTRKSMLTDALRKAGYGR